MINNILFAKSIKSADKIGLVHHFGLPDQESFTMQYSKVVVEDFFYEVFWTKTFFFRCTFDTKPLKALMLIQSGNRCFPGIGHDTINITECNFVGMSTAHEYSFIQQSGVGWTLILERNNFTNFHRSEVVASTAFVTMSTSKTCGGSSKPSLHYYKDNQFINCTLPRFNIFAHAGFYSPVNFTMDNNKFINTKLDSPTGLLDLNLESAALFAVSRTQFTKCTFNSLSTIFSVQSQAPTNSITDVSLVNSKVFYILAMTSPMLSLSSFLIEKLTLFQNSGQVGQLFTINSHTIALSNVVMKSMDLGLSRFMGFNGVSTAAISNFSLSALTFQSTFLISFQAVTSCTFKNLSISNSTTTEASSLF